MRRIAILMILLVFVTLVAKEIPQGINELVEAYQTALAEKSMGPLAGRLAENFDYSGAGTELSPMVLEQVITMGVYQISDISSIEVQEMDGFTRVTFTGMISAMGEQKEGTDVIDVVQEDGVWKILALGSGVAQPMIIQDPTTELKFGLEGPNYTSIDFNPDYDHIIIEAQLKDGRKVNFVVDNGTPISVIDFAYADEFDSELPMASAAEAIGAGGEIDKTGAVMVDYLKINELQISGLTAITMDISHLSDALGIEIVGLLGTDFLSKFAWTLDYSGHRLLLHRLDDKGSIVSDNENDPITTTEPTHVIAFDRTMHLLYTIAQFAPTVTANVVLDCGAGAGVVIPEIFEIIPEDSYEKGEIDTLIGADKAKRVVESITPEALTIGPVERDDYMVAISDLSHLNVQALPTKVDAIIGYNFFSDWLITTWYNKDIIELRPIPK